MARKVPNHFKSKPNPLAGKSATRTIRTLPGAIGVTSVNARRAHGASTGGAGVVNGFPTTSPRRDDKNFLPASANPKRNDPFQGLLPG